MLETAIISNLMYVNLMSFENIGFSEESLVFSDSEKVPFKRNCVDDVYRVNVPFENNAYLWVELKENTGEDIDYLLKAMKNLEKWATIQKENLKNLFFPE